MLNELPPVEHIDARSVSEAARLLAKHGPRARVIAGGTDLLGLMKDRVEGESMPLPDLLVNTKGISDMGVIRLKDDGGLQIGANVTLAEIQVSELVKERFDILRQACESVATPQIRNVATVAGNLCQRPWCWYFRQPAFDCFKKGGRLCYAITGEHQYYFSVMGLGVCIAAHPSDLAPSLVALGASVTVVDQNDRRVIPLDEFFTGPRQRFENVLRSDEIIVDIDVPSQADGTRGVYLKSRPRHSWDFALASSAVLLDVSDGRCERARVVMGGLAPYPYRSRAAEDVLKGKAVDEHSAKEAAREAMNDAKGLPMNRYKLDLGRTIVRRAILAAAGTVRD